jgi:hypothetical protein
MCVKLPAMFTIIGGDGREYGPATVEQIRAWVGDGRASLDTQARRSGDDQWRRLGDYPEFNDAGASQPPPVSPGTPAAAAAPTGEVAVDPAAYAADLIARAPKLDVFGCLERSWELLKGNFWPLVGGTLIWFFVVLLANMIPFVGMVVGILFTGVFYGGLYLLYLKRIRGKHSELGDVFAGFSIAFVPLMLATLVSSLLTTLGILLLILPGIYLGVAYMFTYLLVIDQRLEFWAAMEVSRRVITAQWWRMFGLLLLGSLIAMLGLVIVGIGIFITMPIYIGAVVYAYEDLCSPPPKS